MMALASGTKLGPYEIQAQLGAGGMGQVYKARDTRLDRTVAIKVLPPALSANPESRQRFERETKAVSSLNHPRICVLHDVGQQDEKDYIVMELLEGVTLADRMAIGPMPTYHVLRYGMEIAYALDKAHHKGVVQLTGFSALAEARARDALAEIRRNQIQNRRLCFRSMEARASSGC